MTNVPRNVITGLTILLILSSILGCGLGRPTPDLEATVQARVSATDVARATASAEAEAADTLPEALAGHESTSLVGTIATSGAVEVFVPPSPGGEPPVLSVRPVDEPLPPPPEGAIPVGDAFDISHLGELSEPALLTLHYDPADLPPGVQEENLVIAGLVDDEWQIVPDGLVDTNNHTVSASVEHFSIYSLFEGAAEIAYGVVETLVGDEIGSARYEDLPRQVRRDLDRNDIAPQDITAIVSAKLSLVTKAASGVISFANLVSKTAGILVSVVDNQEAVAEAMTELAVAEGGGEVGSFTVMLYDSYSLGKDLGHFAAQVYQGSPHVLAAKTAAWLLNMEMEYINANMDQAFAGLWTFNTLEASRLHVLAVYVDAEPWLEHLGWGAKGVKFYYYDENRGEWVNYYDDMVYWKIEFEPQVEIAREESPTEASPPTATRVPTRTSTPKPTSTRTRTPEPTLTGTPTLTPEPTATATITPMAGPAEVWVLEDGTGDFPDLETAIRTVYPGSTIFVGRGTHHLDNAVEVDKDLTLIGEGMGESEILGGPGPYMLRFTKHDHVALSDLTFTYMGIDTADVVVIDGGELDIYHCHFQGADGEESANLKIVGDATGYVRESRFGDRNAHTGILVGGSASVALENNQLVDMTVGIHVTDSARPKVTGNTAVDNYQAGIQISGQADTILEYNQLIDNYSSGILYTGQGGGIARDNLCTGAVYYGIDVRDSASPELENNEITQNGGYGVVIECSCSVVARRNPISFNDDGGVRIKAGQVTLEANEINMNGGSGVWVVGDARLTADGNMCSHNDGEGIYFGDNASGTVRDNDCSDNIDGVEVADYSDVIAEDNVCNSNRYFGIYLDDSASLVARGNQCNFNDSIGICVSDYWEGSRAEIIDNECANNDWAGIVADTPGVYLSGNRCYGNGEWDVLGPD